MRFAVSFVLGLAISQAGGEPASPYLGQEAREIKALSAQEVSDLLAGKGMGFARAAELNGYPGPMHVLELAGQLELSADQLESSRSIFSDMQARAMAAGQDLVALERELDRQFREKSVTPESMQSLLARIGELQGELRQVHLQAHLQQAELLSDAQIAAYSQLRGYAGNEQGSDEPGHQHH